MIWVNISIKMIIKKFKVVSDGEEINTIARAWD